MTDQQFPPAWYADPLQRHQYRYWDGSCWTDHVSTDGRQSTDPYVYAPAPNTLNASSPVRRGNVLGVLRNARAKAQARAAERAVTRAAEATAVATARAEAKAAEAARVAEKQAAEAARAAAALADAERAAATERAERAAKLALQTMVRKAPAYPLAGSDRWPNIEVEGEFARMAAIHKVIGRKPGVDEEVVLEDVAVRLIPEPHNPFDSNAVMVWIGGHHVGYLGREDAARFQTALSKVFAAGYAPTVSGRVWASTRNRWDASGRAKQKFVARVSVSLGEPHLLTPLNDPPHGEYGFLPHGGSLQVTGEEQHQDVLSNYVTAEGDALAIGSLHVIQGGSARAPKELIEIRIDGERIGQLTPVTSAHYVPAVRHLEANGLTTCAWLRVKGSVISAQVTIHAARSHELPAGWFERPHTVPRLRTATTCSNDDNAADLAEIRAHMSETASPEPMWDD